MSEASRENCWTDDNSDYPVHLNPISDGTVTHHNGHKGYCKIYSGEFSYLITLFQMISCGAFSVSAKTTKMKLKYNFNTGMFFGVKNLKKA